MLLYVPENEWGRLWDGLGILWKRVNSLLDFIKYTGNVLGREHVPVISFQR